jgi:hypothetical protein
VIAAAAAGAFKKNRYRQEKLMARQFSKRPIRHQKGVLKRQRQKKTF